MQLNDGSADEADIAVSHRKCPLLLGLKSDKISIGVSPPFAAKELEPPMLNEVGILNDRSLVVSNTITSRGRIGGWLIRLGFSLTYFDKRPQRCGREAAGIVKAWPLSLSPPVRQNRHKSPCIKVTAEPVVKGVDNPHSCLRIF